MGLVLRMLVHVMRLGSEVKLAPEQEDETDLVILLDIEKIKYPYTVTENNLAFTNRSAVTAKAAEIVSGNFDLVKGRRVDKRSIIFGSHVSHWWSSCLWSGSVQRLRMFVARLVGAITSPICRKSARR